MICPNCGCEDTKLILTPESIHYAKNVCRVCGRWISWEKSPDTNKNSNRKIKLSVKRVCEYHNFKTEHCFFCLRVKEQLGLNETLTVDHIEELSKGGADNLSNFQVLCTACHKLKDWCRLYINWHFIK